MCLTCNRPPKRSPIRSQAVPTYLITPISYALADIRADRLRALGVTTNTRSPLLSEVPTIAESGVTGFDYPIGMAYGCAQALRPEWWTN